MPGGGDILQIHDVFVLSDGLPAQPTNQQCPIPGSPFSLSTDSEGPLRRLEADGRIPNNGSSPQTNLKNQYKETLKWEVSSAMSCAWIET